MTRNARGTNQTKKQGGGSNAMDANWARAWLRVRECGCEECWDWAHGAKSMDKRRKRQHLKRFPHSKVLA